MTRRLPLSVLAGAVIAVAAACGGGDRPAAPAAEITANPTASKVAPPDETATPATSEPAVASRIDDLTGAPLPPPDAAVVDFDEDRFFANAGSFPALTDPAIVAASEATWLEDSTLVLGATQNGEARAYPIFQLRFHHVSNDVLGGDPYLVTF